MSYSSTRIPSLTYSSTEIPSITFTTTEKSCSEAYTKEEEEEEASKIRLTISMCSLLHVSHCFCFVCNYVHVWNLIMCSDLDNVLFRLFSACMELDDVFRLWQLGALCPSRVFCCAQALRMEHRGRMVNPSV
jgi:hypothetical protein